jgi:hypothetical protein
MDREFAILMLNACYRASREIGEIGVMAQEFSPGEDGRGVKMQAGVVIAEIGKLTDAVFHAHPDLEAYVESRIGKFGRLS